MEAWRHTHPSRLGENRHIPQLEGKGLDRLANQTGASPRVGAAGPGRDLVPTSILRNLPGLRDEWWP